MESLSKENYGAFDRPQVVACNSFHANRSAVVTEPDESDMNRHFPIVLLLVVATLAVFAQVHSFDFINYDDEDYIAENPMVARGLSGESIRWAFTATQSAVWQPLTWISLMSDVTRDGLDPGRFHVHNLVLHLLNVILLYALLFLTTRASWPSGLVALLFAIHPLHVESVAWVAERKDVLAVFWGLISLIAYVHFARTESKLSYALSIVAKALGLMAKPLLVVWPAVMLLLDWWPLRRMGARMEGENPLSPSLPRRPVKRLLLEKIPFFVLALISSGIVYRVHSKAGAVGGLESVPFIDRLANAAVSYLRYLELTFWPRDHSILYPHPNLSGGTPLSPLQIALAIGLVAVLTAAMIRWRRRRYLTVGWLMYLGTLVPVIGLVQFGTHAMADRFTYIPLVGIFIALAWGARDLHLAMTKRGRGPQWLVPGVAFALALALVFPARELTAKWSDSITLYEYSLESGPGSPKIHYNLGLAYSRARRHDDAIVQYRKAIELQPHHDRAWNNLGRTYGVLGQFAEGEKAFDEALRLQPEQALIRVNYAQLLERAGRVDAAIEQRMIALGLEEQFANVNQIGVLLAQSGRLEESIQYFRRGVQLQPNNPNARENLANAQRLLQQGARTRE